MVGGYETECTHNSKYQLGPRAGGSCIHGNCILLCFSSNTSYFSLCNYGLGHPTLGANLSNSSGLDHSSGSTVIAVSPVRRSLMRVAACSWNHHRRDATAAARAAGCNAYGLKTEQRRADVHAAIIISARTRNH